MRTRNGEEISLIKSTMNYSIVEELSCNYDWQKKLFDIVQAIEVYLALVGGLQPEAQMPKAIYCAVSQFGMVALPVCS